jgi:tetratricopeptide (TPR) repeat protein
MAYINRSTSLAKWGSRRRFKTPDELALVSARLRGDASLPGIGDEREGLQKQVDERPWPTLPGDDDRARLRVQALAAWGAALIVTVDQRDAGPSDAGQRTRRRRDEVLGVLEKIVEELGGAPAARALVENAIARVQLRQNRLDKARDAAETALVLSPDLGDAHITLAEIAIRPPLENDWSSETERHLLRALEVSPKDIRARYKLGVFYKSIGDDRRAKEAFAELVADWRALDRLGEIHLENAEYVEAIRCFVLSQGRHETSDYRAERLVKAVLDLAKIPGVRLLERDAEPTARAAQRIVKDAKDAARKRVAQARQAELKKAVTYLTRPPDLPEPPLPGPD